MNSLTMRMGVAASILILLFAGAWFTIYKGGIYREIRQPKEPISSFIPKEIAGWKGANMPVDEKLFEAIDAKEVLSRNYKNPRSDREISLHSALFVQFWRWLPHKPMSCYTGSGWTTIKREPFELEAPDGAKGTAQLVHFEKENAKIFVLFWYHFGDYLLVDTEGLFKARQKYRSEDTWPPILKIMLQISADRPEKAMEELKEFADALYDKTRKMK